LAGITLQLQTGAAGLSGLVVGKLLGIDLRGVVVIGESYGGRIGQAQMRLIGSERTRC